MSFPSALKVIDFDFSKYICYKEHMLLIFAFFKKKKQKTSVANFLSKG